MGESPPHDGVLLGTGAGRERWQQSMARGRQVPCPTKTKSSKGATTVPASHKNSLRPTQCCETLPKLRHLTGTLGGGFRKFSRGRFGKGP